MREFDFDFDFETTCRFVSYRFDHLIYQVNFAPEGRVTQMTLRADTSKLLVVTLHGLSEDYKIKVGRTQY